MFQRLSVEGTMFELLDPDASLLRDAYPWGGYEPSLCALLARDVVPGVTFIDVGALYGFYSVWGSLRGAEVIAFEPSTEHGAVLALNLERNDCTSVRHESIALADADSSRPFASRTLVSSPTPRRRGRLPSVPSLVRRTSQPSESVVAACGHWRASPGPWVAARMAAALGMFGAGSDRVCRVVPTASLDRWALDAGVTPNIVKIDVHGGEAGVLRGMPRVLRDSVTAVAVEVHRADLLVDGTHREIVEMLEASGLGVYELRRFRRSRGELVRLVGDARTQFCEERRWSAADLRDMRCLYARRR